MGRRSSGRPLVAPRGVALATLVLRVPAIAHVARGATAYINRDAAYDCFPVSIWSDPGDDAANIEWARELYTAMKPFAIGGIYVNNLGDEGEDRIREAYGSSYDRLAALKRKYDPDNLFRRNQNIRPNE